MAKTLHHISDDFLNIRGTFKVAGVVNVGTHSSLVRRSNGRYLLLDSYTLEGEALAVVQAATDGGALLDGILNLHPFHTVHVPALHAQFPDAPLHGTPRHREKAPDLPWSEPDTQDPALFEQFADDLQFTVPEGVDFISGNEQVHFSSVLCYHPASRTLHVDDTFNYLGGGGLLGLTGLGDTVSFHPTLARALQKRAGAAREFESWAHATIERWRDAQNLCAAHTAALIGVENQGASLHERLLAALEKISPVLDKHESRYG